MLRSSAQQFRASGVTLALICGLGLFAWVVEAHLPIRHWLFWRYAGYWLASATLCAAAFASGSALLLRVLRRPLPSGEHCVLSLALGLFAFFLCWFVLGLLRLHGPVAFFVAPLALLLAGARPTLSWLRRLRRRTRRLGTAGPGSSLLGRGLLVLGVLAVALVYFPILTPANVSYDSRWYHMAIAEHYAADGGIRPFAGGWFLGTYPHLASVLYSWAFAMPVGRLFDRVELAAHLEFALFLATLCGIPTLVRRLLRHGRPSLAWVAMFAFPGLFLYDSNLNGGADHVAAFWAVPIFLALLRAYPLLDRGHCVVLGVCISGALLTKYSALGLAVFPGIAIGARALALWSREARATRHPLRRARVVAGAVLMGATILAGTSPHWLKNWIWHGDPVYPLGHRVFASTPWTVDSADRFLIGDYEHPQWVPERSWRGLAAAAKALLLFSFVPNDWPEFHGTVPVFGSLFTLSLGCLPFLRRPGRLVALYASTHVAILTWYWTHHQDRYLQAFLPWMAAAMAAVAIAVWEMGIAPRLALVTLGAFQIVWGADVPFIPNHAMIGDTPHKASLNLLASGHRGNYEGRFVSYPLQESIAAALPKGARLLLHEEHVRLGFGVPVVSDWVGWQGGISYGRAPAPDQVYDRLRALGVTHLVWPTGVSRGHDSLAGDIAFFRFAVRYGENPQRHGRLSLAGMPANRPPAGSIENVALVLVCPGTYLPGLYQVGDLVAPFRARSASDFPRPRVEVSTLEDAAPIMARADAVVADPQCFQATERLSEAGFVLAAARGAEQIWLAPRDHDARGP